MLLTKEIEITCTPNNKKHLVGYNWKYREKIRVKIEDLYPSCHSQVEVLCDYCLEKGVHTFLYPSYKTYYNSRKIIAKDCCQACHGQKMKDVVSFKYGNNHFNKVRQSNEKPISNYIDIFISKNLIPLVDTYIYIKDIIPCKCSIHNIIIDNLSINQIKTKIYPCKECLHEFKKYNQRKDLDEVKEEFLINGLMVCDDAIYENSFTKIKCYCLKHPQEIQYINRLQAVRKYHGCKFCKEIMKVKENNPNWKGGIKPINDQIRASNEYKEWVRKVFEKDHYTCQCCKDNAGGNLQAHHIENFSTNEELRFDVNNGITLCDLCHNPNKHGSFHNIYGTYNNNKNQLVEYINKYNNGEFETIRLKNVI